MALPGIGQLPKPPQRLVPVSNVACDNCFYPTDVGSPRCTNCGHLLVRQGRSGTDVQHIEVAGGSDRPSGAGNWGISVVIALLLTISNPSPEQHADKVRQVVRADLSQNHPALDLLSRGANVLLGVDPAAIAADRAASQLKCNSYLVISACWIAGDLVTFGVASMVLGP